MARKLHHRRWLSTLSLLGLLGLVAASSEAAIVSNFESGANGWTVSGGTLAHASAEGNPDGHIRATDGLNGIMELVAPQKFLGDLTGFDRGVFSLDLIDLKTAGSEPLSQTGELTISGPGGETTVNLLTGPPPTEWTTVSTPLAADAFGLSESAWLGILADVTAIRLAVDLYQDFDDTMGVDNVTIQAVPLPGSVALLGSALLGLAARRRALRRLEKHGGGALRAQA